MNKLHKKIRHLWWLLRNYIKIAMIYSPLGFIKIKTRFGGITLVEFRKNGPLGDIGESIHCIEDKVILRDINKYGFLDKATVNFFIHKINVHGEDFDFIDIGANQGFISIPILRHLQPNSVNANYHLFEPQSMYFTCLQKNTEKYQNVNLYNYGLDCTNNYNELYRSERNATATVNPDLAFDSFEKLTSENCYFKNTYEQIENILENNTKDLFIKSDVDHNDWEIFLTLKPLLGYVKAYALELQLHNIDFSSDKKATFIKEIRAFDNFYIINKKGHTVNQSDVPNYILNNSDIVNIYLSK